MPGKNPSASNHSYVWVFYSVLSQFLQKSKNSAKTFLLIIIITPMGFQITDSYLGNGALSSGLKILK